MPHPYDALQAIEQGNIQRLRDLLTEEAELVNARDEQGVSLVLRAMYRHSGDALDALLSHAPQLDVFTAAALGDERRLSAILAQDALAVESYQGDGFTPLQLACFFGSVATAKLILERGANPEAVSRNPMELRAIHAAAASRNQEVMELLLSHGVDVNSRQHGGWTALHAAVNNRDLGMSKRLLSAGADPRASNDFDQCPADIARDKGDEALLRLLDS